MAKLLLITDNFFISPAHVQKLVEAGYDVKRLDKAAATEEELIEALNGVSVYIIGGIEQVTDKVLDSTDALQAIIFTGVDYSKFVPGEKTAVAKGIKIFNAPGANAVAVAEFAVAVALAMQRQLFTISRNSDKKFVTTKSIEDSVVGVIGAGNIGKCIIDAVSAYKPKGQLYFNRSEKDVNAERSDLEQLVATADIIFLTLPASAGTVFDNSLISKIKTGALLVSISPNNLIDYHALLPRLEANEIRAAIDWPSPTEAFERLPLDVWLSFNSHSAYNTHAAIKNVNDSVTATAVDLLKSNNSSPGTLD
ncbi:MAG: NAD(P)-dependent oxidoreductase [Candidatus Saccharibacteria bacterium]